MLRVIRDQGPRLNRGTSHCLIAEACGLLRPRPGGLLRETPLRRFVQVAEYSWARSTCVARIQDGAGKA